MLKERMDMYMFAHSLHTQVETRPFYYPKWSSADSTGQLSIMGGGTHSVKEMTRRVCECAAVVASRGAASSSRVATAVSTTSVDSDDDDDNEWEQSCSDDDDGGGGSVVVGATPHSTPAPELTPVEPMTEAAAAVTLLAATAATPAPLVATPAAQPARQRRYQGHERAELGSTFRRPPSKRRREPLVLVCKCGYCGRHVTCDQ